MKQHYVEILKQNRDIIVSKWASQEKTMMGTSYQNRPLDELINTCGECFDAYIDIMERGDFSKMRRFIEKISHFRVHLGFKLAEVQRAFFIFKIVTLQFLKDEPIKGANELLDIIESFDLCVTNTLFELSEVYQRHAQEEIEQHIGNIEAMNQQLARLSITDGLTGLYNHRYFHENCEKEIKKSKRYKTVFSVCLFDIDDFKNVNDQHGHLSGDEVLKSFAKIMRQQTREVDQCFRYGGEEFAILLPETDSKGSIMVADRVREQFALTQFVFEKGSINVTVSGGAICNSSYPHVERAFLIDEVDKLVYKAKQEGKNKICYFSEETSK